MAILEIRIMGDPVLRTVAEPVTEFGPELAKLIADMFETMDDVDGVGLAAPQVGVSKQIFTYRIGELSGHVINPVLENGEANQPSGAEGCLSVPGLGYAVERKQTSRVRGMDMNGNPVLIEADGMLARCMQHETDHLNGKLFIDRLTGDDRRAAMRTIRDAQFDQMSAKTTAHRAQTIGSSFSVNSGTRA
ncbi:peptide deformylase [Renibacterium salmoninarum ATCC 33209]|uniref:Peptide deformylase n=1 Tax=Renibacterium salmoninarum (strain ATCC 33209 / DSM 20767 / JCM 11484 / NBRC 15589 / NCIMB 2235) TaxID=288705 RepID=A9WR75_RENSM|nr:peptide deformylase [Renibacterium salmoninarum]ABY24084.1 peptide deformylase [Renibacterium salmoninarum ATCC 33209]